MKINLLINSIIWQQLTVHICHSPSFDRGDHWKEDPWEQLFVQVKKKKKKGQTQHSYPNNHDLEKVC